MSTNFDFDLLEQQADKAPTAGFGPQRNFGKMKMTVKVVTWKDGKPLEKVWDNKPLKDGQQFRFVLESDLSELNPALTNPYKRQIDWRVSRVKDGKVDPKAMTDYTETVERSALTTIGKDWKKKLGNGIYCEWEDVETVELDKQGNKKGWDKKDKVTGELILDDAGNIIHYTNTVPRFLRAFKSKAECQAAREARFSKAADAAADDEESESGIPADVLKDAAGLISSVGMKQARLILESTPPYSEYDIDDLIENANPL